MMLKLGIGTNGKAVKMAQICDRPQAQNLSGIRPNPFPPYDPIFFTELIQRPKI